MNKMNIMKTEINVTQKKRIAVVAPFKKRKALIDWSYFNKDMLNNHELIANSYNAHILEGIVNTSITSLTGNNLDELGQLSIMIQNKKVDIVYFFENPVKIALVDNSVKDLIDLAGKMKIDIQVAGQQLPFPKA
jgi:methylglyoxal synthase